MLHCLAGLLLCLVTHSSAELSASMVEVTGKESFAELLVLLSKTGNKVVDESGADQKLLLQLTPGRQPFWKVLDEAAAKCQLQIVQRTDSLALIPQASPRTSWIAYDGPWRARILRRSIIAYDDPTLNRLVLQVELSIEPRYLPLLLTLRTASATWPGADVTPLTQRSTYSFDGETSRTFEVRLPIVPRQVPKLDQFILTGEAWVAPDRLTFSVPLQSNASQTQKGTAFTVKQIDVQSASKTWEVSTELVYPEGSLDWESHQSRLLSSMKLTLTHGKQQLADAGKDIRTDQGRHTTARWIFRNVPNQTAGWQAVLTAPAAPIQVPLRLVFSGIEMP